MEVTVAYTSNAKKRTQFFEGLTRAARDWCGQVGPTESSTKVCVRLIPLFTGDEVTRETTEGEIHAIIHKRTDDMALLKAHADEGAILRIRCLTAALGEEGDVTAIDDLDGVWRLIDRCRISRAVDAALAEGNGKKKIVLRRCRRLALPARLPCHVPVAVPAEVDTLPWACVPTAAGTAAVRRALAPLRFPVILKRRLACGTKASHEMVVAFDMHSALAAIVDVFRTPVSLPRPRLKSDPRALSPQSSPSHCYSPHALPTSRNNVVQADDSDPNHIAATTVHADLDATRHEPTFVSDVVAQEFIPDHGGVLFKVYAIGDNVVVQPRASITITSSTLISTTNTNLSTQHLRPPQEHQQRSNNNNDNNNGINGYYYFDSQQLNHSKAPQRFEFDPSTGFSKRTQAIMPPNRLAQRVVKALSLELGLALIGIDMIYDVRSRRYFIVDVNYFPGYKGVANAYEWILQHICNRVWQDGRLFIQ